VLRFDGLGAATLADLLFLILDFRQEVDSQQFSGRNRTRSGLTQ